MTLGAAKRKVAARVEIPGLDGNAKAFAAKEFTASFDIEEDGSSTRVKLASPLAGSVERRQFELPRLAARLNLSSPRLPKGPIEATLNGALTVDAAKETANLTFATKLDESTINGRAGLAKFAPPSYTFDVDVDRLDADRYFPKTSEQKRAPGGGEPKGQGQGEEQPIDLAALRDVNASGTLKIGALKVSGLQTRNVRLDVKAANGTVDVNPIAANLYQGALAGALMIDAAKTPSFAIKQKLTGVDIGPLIRDLSGNDMLEGTGNVNVDVKTQGNTVSALKKGLNGNAAVRLTDGALKGINIAGAIRSVRAKLGALRGEQVQQSDRTQKTDFTELNATFTIRDGIAHNSDLEMKSPLLRASGEGDINIVDGTVDYLIKATIVATTKGQGGRDLADLQGVTVPVRVSGPLEDPSYKLDFAAIASDAAKKKIESTVREELERRLEGGAREGKPGGDLKDQLKGLFGR